jgi:hypothetical protein
MMVVGTASGDWYHLAFEVTTDPSCKVRPGKAVEPGDDIRLTCEGFESDEVVDIVLVREADPDDSDPVASVTDVSMEQHGTGEFTLPVPAGTLLGEYRIVVARSGLGPVVIPYAVEEKKPGKSNFVNPGGILIPTPRTRS